MSVRLLLPFSILILDHNVMVILRLSQITAGGFTLIAVTFVD